MRRPLKPFVTEYKGSRRASSPFSEPSLQPERPTQQPAEFKPKSPAESDDAYEAAMRAADALFSSAPQKDGAGTQTVRAPAPGQSGTAEPAAPERGGRVLRVVDEAPPPQFAALEAEHAPKRRGRKPGSKNKPKIAPPETHEFGQPAVANTATNGTSATAPDSADAAPAFPPQRQLVALSTSPSSGGGDRRFAWVRDRLKPGENWKRRRLPRVCW